MHLRRGLSLEDIEALYRAEYSAFLRTASAIVGDRRAGEDAVHDAFVNAVRRRRQFRGRGSAEAWLWTIVLNAARARRREPFPELTHDAQEPVLSSALEDSPRRMLIRELVEELPERQRLALFLRYYADLDYRTIAAVLGIRQGTVSATIHAAHATLRQALLEVD